MYERRASRRFCVVSPMIDIGANLASESFEADRGVVLARAARAGVAALVITGSSRESSHQALAIVHASAAAVALGQSPALFSTAGLHPHHASDWDATLAGEFRALAARPEVVALGECGLDYFRDLSPRPVQRSAFAAQLALAAECGKPVFLHQRDAHADFHAILREHRGQLVDCVVHCFTDVAAALDDYLALDCYVGITGWISDERRGAHLRPLVGRIPADRLLVETDAPYLLPRNLKPRPVDRRNEPAYLPWVVAAVAAAREEDPALVAAATARNARRFFRLPPAGGSGGSGG